jgi:hypothetical protein
MVVINGRERERESVNFNSVGIAASTFTEVRIE